MTAVSSTTVTFEAPLAPGTKTCRIAYRLAAPEFNERPMVKGATSFSVSIGALPSSTSIDYRVVCDGAEGPLLKATTTPRLGPPPRRPVVLAATRVGGDVTFECTSDPSEPTVYWAEIGKPGQWSVFPDQEGTFGKKKMGVSGSPSSKISVRMGIRNSSGVVYSPIVP